MNVEPKKPNSGDGGIDTYIEKTQLEASYECEYLKWVDPRQFTETEHIANGGFGSVYRATWKDAPVNRFEVLKDRKVALKTIKGSKSILLNEVLLPFWCLHFT